MAQSIVLDRKENQVSLQSYGYSDISLNNREIYDLIDALKSERLSQASILKLQLLNRQFMAHRNLLQFLAVPSAWMLSGWLMVNPRTSWTRYRVVMTIFLAYPIGKMLRNVPIKRRLATDLISQDGEDGEYIRKDLRKWKPGLWSKLSTQLYHLGYQFPEMNEFQNSVQFPSGAYNGK